jgi:hypothetical protein
VQLEQQMNVIGHVVPTFRVCGFDFLRVFGGPQVLTGGAAARVSKWLACRDSAATVQEREKKCLR